MIVAGESPDQDVHLASILGEVAGEFFAGEHVRAIEDFRDAIDRVVIGDGDEVHAAAPGLGVHIRRLAVTFRTADRIQRGFIRLCAGDAVTVKIDSLHRWRERIGHIRHSLLHSWRKRTIRGLPRSMNECRGSIPWADHICRDYRLRL